MTKLEQSNTFAQALAGTPAVEESTVETSPVKSAEKVEEVEEQAVPYSRFSTVARERRELARELEEAQARLEEVQNSRDTRPSYSENYDDAFSREVIELYGDNENAKRIIEIERRKWQAVEERAEQRALEALERRELTEKSAVLENEEILDTEREDFEGEIGRPLAEDEYEALLDIADKYSPVGRDGKYLSGKPLPLEQAAEIYELQIEKENASSRRSRSTATSLTNTRSSGEPSGKVEADANWQPRMGNWRQRFNS